VKVLVTGAAGFLGSHLCDSLITQGHEVIGVDNFFTGNKRNLSHLLGNPSFDLIRHDVTFPLYIECDAILNFACPASPVHYQRNPVETLKTNVHGAINMLGLAKRTGARILQASTSEVYGDPEVHPQPESYRGQVNPLGPRACYDEGKRAAESLCFDFKRVYNLDVRVMRIFNTYGPGEMPGKYRNVIPNFFQKAARNEDIIITGDGNELRDFTYVDDTVDLIIKLYQSNYWSADIFNSGTGRHCKIIDLANNILTVTESKSKIIYTKRRAWDGVKTRVSDISKSKNLLNYNPNISLAAGLKVTWEWLRGRI
jgi:UDP-glucuronate decarboxylase